MKTKGIILAILAVFGTVAWSASGVDVVVASGFDYTNVIISVDGSLGAEVSVVDSANVEVAPEGPLAPASAYAYDVRQGGVSIASGAFATGHDEANAGGEWTIPPEPWEDRLWVRDAAKMDFALPPSNRVTRTDMRT